MLSLDPDGTVRFVNDALAVLTGYDREALTGVQFETLVPDDWSGRVREAIDGAAAQPIDLDVPVERADGLSVPVRLSGQAETRDGAVGRIHCQLEPRTDPEASGASLPAQNALLRTLVDGLSIGVLAETADRTVLAVNDELLSMFDIPGDRGDLVGRDCADLARSASEGFADSSGFVAGVQARIDEGEPVSGERLERADGRVFERTYRPVEIPGGHGHLWTYEDVTDQRAREAELETYERLVEVAPVGVFRTTTDGRVLTANRRLADILGYENESDLIADYEELAEDLYVDPSRRGTFLDRLEEAGVVEDFEYEAATRNDGRRWLSMNARLLDETDDGARVITGFTWDVTERRRHERQLAVLGRILRHNLRNALTVIEGQTELLCRDAVDSPDAAREKIFDRVEGLLELADKEREIVHLLRGPTDHVQRDLCAIAETVRTELRAEHPAATITVTAPESAPVCVCVGFERAITELVENAILHAESDRPDVELTIRVDGERTEVEVRDDGPGIPDVERRMLRGSLEESPLYHSVGIGLFLVRQLVDFSDGTLSVEDNEPRGSVVRIGLQSA